MARTVELSHTFPFSWEHYLDLHFGRDFINHVRNSVDVHEYRIELLETHEKRRTRTLMVAPNVTLSPMMRRLLRSKRISYLVTSTIRPNSRIIEWSVLPNVLIDKLTLRGELIGDELGPKKCRRTVRIEIDARILGIGGRIEQTLEESIHKSFADTRDLMIAYTQQHAA